MPLPPEFDQALAILYARLKTAQFSWAFTGSVGMVIQGMRLDAHDIDLQTDQAGAYIVQDLFKEFVSRPVVFSPAERIRSHYGALDIGGVEVEIMGDIEGRLPNGEWLAPPDLAVITRWVDYTGMRLPVLDLEYEYQAYLRMGRVEKAAKMRQFLDGEK